MIAVDTNVLVRLVVDDDPDQTRRARKLFERGDVLVTSTVLLEAAWVLASAYGRTRPKVSRALRGVLGLDGVSTDVGGGPRDPMLPTNSTIRGAMYTDCTQCHTQIHGSDLPEGMVSGHKMLR